MDREKLEKLEKEKEQDLDVDLPLPGPLVYVAASSALDGRKSSSRWLRSLVVGSRFLLQ
jgi:hypothetical protein